MDGRRRVVTAADHAAHAAGLRVGMPLTKAQALVENLAVYNADPDGDRDALERLAGWALQTYSPVVAADPPDGLILDITGAAHLHGGEPALLEGMIRRLADKGIEACAAIADTWGAAHALSRFGARFGARPVVIIPPGNSAQAVRNLPVAALRVPYSLVQSLSVLGFDAIGELIAQPRAPLVHRFGRELGRRLDQISGHLAEPIDPVDLPDVTEVKQVFFEPIGAPETLARYTAKLTQQLCDALEARGEGARQLDLHFIRVDGRIEAIRIGTAKPVRDTARLTRLLCDKIETVDPGFGIEGMRLIATLAEPLIMTQTSSQEAAGPDLAGLVDTLSNRIGGERVYRLSAVESDVPERSVRRSPALSAVRSGWPVHWPRPVRLFRRPEPVETLAVLPDHPPKVLTWRGVRHRVLAADGPERIFGEWWKHDSETWAVRDYFRVELDTGERLWVFRSGDGEDGATGSHKWFLHGMFA
ncbi:nucleotidyltransferase/DNA polymerase involved in DNA repair-like protein [Asticcacaulis biprosthecium C19]|uniref:Nucleotidyltransferase/DNA polymerase involved in DNA repair-like protein n=2 Tax=Asticcacaulis biprosthecium TaxID=76891 RepID=F4QRT5_9CAUL|nr:nucleotidyltransferase/DNA polymerase involved in DNA repair-like protein [Asticcacaulis biprosthecium C19]